MLRLKATYINNRTLKICKHTCKIYGAALLVSAFSLISWDALSTDGKGASVKISFTTLNRITSPKI